MADEDRQHPGRWRTRFETGSTIAMVILASVLVWQNRDRATNAASARSPVQMQTALLPKEPISIDDAATLGAASARVAVIEYPDFECPACAQFVRELKPTLKREYIDKGRVKFAFKHFPLPMHQKAPGAAAAAWCAARQGKFWTMHDWLFASPLNMESAAVTKPPSEIGLDLAMYESCRAGGEAAKHVQAARAEGEALQVPATPVFFFGKVTSDGRVRVTETWTGARSAEAFRKVLNQLLD